MGDEAFQTKKNEPTHLSLRCLEQAVCCIMYCNSGPNFPRSPADVTSDDAECVSSTAWIQEEEARWTQNLVFVQYGFCCGQKRPTTTLSPLKSNLKKKMKALSAASRESKRHYEQSRAGTRIYIGYALESWRQLQLELGLETDADMAHFLVTS